MSGQLQRATLAPKDAAGSGITFKFNPKEVIMDLAAVWTGPMAPGKEDPPHPTFQGTKQKTLMMNQVLFDCSADPSGNITADIDKITAWLRPTSDSAQQDHPQPPVLVMHWGSQTYFDCYLKSIKVTYKMFDEQGKPLRADVNLTLEEIPFVPEPTNPTSGGPGGSRTHVVVGGDSLQSIAYTAYRRAGYWRALAEINGIDDPMRITPGTRLMIPSRSDAAKLS